MAISLVDTNVQAPPVQTPTVPPVTSEPGPPTPAPSSSPTEGLDWRKYYTPDPADVKLLDSYKTIPDAMKALVHNKRMVGGSVRIPTAESGPDEWNAFYTKLGRPETPEGYTVTPPDLPEGMTFDDRPLKAFLPVAHKLGLTNAQVQELMTFRLQQQMQEQDGETAAAAEEMKRGMEALKKQWGAAFERNYNLAKASIKKWGTPELETLMSDPLIGNNAPLIRYFASVGQMGLESGYIEGLAPDVVLTKEKAQEEQRSLMADKDSGYWDRDHAKHAATRSRVQFLAKVIAGEM